MSQYFPETPSKTVKASVRKRPLSDDEIYERVVTKFPKIEPRPDEDLNIERNIDALLTRLWYDVQNIELMSDIGPIIGLSETHVRVKAKKLKLPKRNIIIEQRLKEELAKRKEQKLQTV